MATSKLAADRNQKIIMELAMKPGNDTCADCKARNPRWASHNLGIFICVNCASIHRKIGTHISKVKSLTLDSWSKEQVDVMKQNGNLKSNSYYNPNETRNPPPANMSEAERDSELEQYIRSKYEYKRFVDRSAIAAAHLGPSRSAASLARPKSTPLTSSSSSLKPASSQQLPPMPSGMQPSTSRTVSQPAVAPPAQTPVSPPVRGSSRFATHPSAPVPPAQSQPTSQPPSNPPAAIGNSSNPVWADLISIQQGGASQSTLPLQYQAPQQPSLQSSLSPLSMQYQTSQPTGYMSSPMQMTPQDGYMQQQQPLATGMSQSWNPPTGSHFGGSVPGSMYGSMAPAPTGTSSIPSFQPQSSFGQQMLSPGSITQHQQSPPQLFQPQPGMGASQNPFHNQQQQQQQQYQTSPSPYGGMPIGGGSPAFMNPSPVMFQQQTGMPQQGYGQMGMGMGMQQPMMQQQQPMQQQPDQFTGWMQTGPGGQPFYGGGM